MKKVVIGCLQDLKRDYRRIRGDIKMEALQETKNGNCEYCGKNALLDKGYKNKYACETCYYEHGHETKIEVREVL